MNIDMRQGVILMICVFIANFIHSENLSLVGNETNDLYRWLLEEKVDVKPSFCLKVTPKRRCLKPKLKKSSQI